MLILSIKAKCTIFFLYQSLPNILINLDALEYFCVNLVHTLTQTLALQANLNQFQPSYRVKVDKQ